MPVLLFVWAPVNPPKIYSLTCPRQGLRDRGSGFRHVYFHLFCNNGDNANIHPCRFVIPTFIKVTVTEPCFQRLSLLVLSWSVYHQPLYYLLLPLSWGLVSFISYSICFEPRKTGLTECAPSSYKSTLVNSIHLRLLYALPPSIYVHVVQVWMSTSQSPQRPCFRLYVMIVTYCMLSMSRVLNIHNLAIRDKDPLCIAWPQMFIHDHSGSIRKYLRKLEPECL